MPSGGCARPVGATGWSPFLGSQCRETTQRVKMSMAVFLLAVFHGQRCTLRLWATVRGRTVALRHRGHRLAAPGALLRCTTHGTVLSLPS